MRLFYMRLFPQAANSANRNFVMELLILAKKEARIKIYLEITSKGNKG